MGVKDRKASDRDHIHAGGFGIRLLARFDVDVIPRLGPSKRTKQKGGHRDINKGGVGPRFVAL
jgi:hypothetical protein